MLREHSMSVLSGTPWRVAQGVLLSVAAVSGTLVFVFVAVAVSIAGQAMVEAWLLRRRLGISSIPGVRDARPSAELMTGRRRQ